MSTRHPAPPLLARADLNPPAPPHQPDVETTFNDRNTQEQMRLDGRDARDAQRQGRTLGEPEERDWARADVDRGGAGSSRDGGVPPAASSASRLATQLDSVTQHSPPLPRMRRTARLSPNARLERAAPSSIPTSDFSAGPSSSARRLMRSSSVPRASSARRRASSVEPIGAVPRVDADLSPSRRHLDPDQHWLSEDESADKRGGGRNPRGRATETSRGPNRRRHDDEDGSKVLGAAVVDLSKPAWHSIHQRPAAATRAASWSPSPSPSPPPPPLALPPLTAILPFVLPLLTCSSCHHLYNNPVTLACGHCRCLDCESSEPDLPLPPSASSSLPANVSTLPSGLAGMSSISPENTPHVDDGKFTAVAPPLTIPGSFDFRSESRASLISEASAPSLSASKRGSIVDVEPLLCLHADCTVPSAFPALATPHIDYALRKIVDLVYRAVPDVERLVVSSKEAIAITPVEEAPLESLLQGAKLGGTPSAPSFDPPPLSQTRQNSGSSGSSGGGEDETVDEEDSKRSHKARKVWKSSKKSRRDEPEEKPTLRSSSRQPHPTPLFDRSLASSTFFSDLVDVTECRICVALLHEPVTAPCGHSYCRSCLTRAYDHSDKCPLCRSDLPPFSFFRTQRANLALSALIPLLLPSLAAERLAAVEEEQAAQLTSVPVFICTAAWPTIKCFLHIFEPRYRLMMRRALESPEMSFGMVLSYKNAQGASVVNDFGTMLRITSANVLEDGRMIVETVGTYRFRLIERAMLDGYTVGRIERVDDVSPEQEATLEQAALALNEHPERWDDPDQQPQQEGVMGPSRPPMTGNMELPTEQLLQICLDFVRTLRAGSAPWVVERLSRTVGEMPTNAHDFTWFAAEVFPVEDHVKITLLQITSVRERLRLIVFWIEQFRSSWWYTRGCHVS